jgi:ABC-type Fe3+-hydroxamate transport system substrate-binding protein
MKRIALALTVAMVLAALGSGGAAADPVNSKKAESFYLTCENGLEFTVVATGGNPGHVVDSTGNFIPASDTVIATDPVTGEVLLSETHAVKGKQVGLHNDLITCTTEVGTFFVPELGQEATVVVTFEGFLTPQGR